MKTWAFVLSDPGQKEHFMLKGFIPNQMKCWRKVDKSSKILQGERFS